MSPIPRSTLFALSPNAYMVVDRDLVYLDANPAYERLAGRRREQLIGRPLFEMFPGDPLDPCDTSAAELRASLRHVLERREPHHVALIRYPIPRVTPTARCTTSATRAPPTRRCSMPTARWRPSCSTPPR